MELTTELIPIGRFARLSGLSGLSVKALRHYDEIGLLEPAAVDPDTGYRRYSLEQARRAEAIRRLRSLEVPLEEIRAVLDDPGSASERLRVHLARLEGRAAETRGLIGRLRRIVDGEEELVPEPVRIKFELRIEEEVPEQRVLLVSERARTDELSTVIPRAIADVHGYLEELGEPFAGPPICICPFPDDEGFADVEVGWPVGREAPGRGRIEAKTLPAVRALLMKHTGPYAELGRSYRLMSEAMERDGLTSAGAPREVYVTDPEEVADRNDYETVIVWPIGPEGALQTSSDVFHRRVEID